MHPFGDDRLPGEETVRIFVGRTRGREATEDLIRNGAGRYPMSEYVLTVNLIAAVLDHGEGDAATRLYVIREILTALETVLAERRER